MNSNIRLEAKRLLSHNTSRLFFISFFSFVFRYLSILCCGYGVFLIYNSSLLSFISKEYGYTLAYFLASLISVTLSFLTLSFVSSVKMGEAFAYFTLANGGNGRFFHLYKFLTPQKSIKALLFYITVTTKKLLWWIFFLFPALICVVCGYYLYQGRIYVNEINLIISTGFSIILAIALVMVRICSLRYSAAPYYLCLNPNLKITDSIKKSIKFTDGFLSEGVLLEYSLLGWLLSCVFVLPLFYVVPYAKLVRSVYVTDVVFSKASSKTKYPIIMSAYKSTP